MSSNVCESNTLEASQGLALIPLLQDDVRKQHLAWFDCLATDVRGSLQHRREEHQQGKVTPMSLEIPFLIAEPFGIDDPTVLCQASLASLCMDDFTHVIDDLSDNPSGQGLITVHAATLLFARATRLYSGISRGNGNFSHCLERYLSEASDAERFLWRHHGIIRPFENIDFEMMGRRGALLNASPCLFAALSDRWNLMTPIEEALLFASTAVQLTDDLLDWREDLQSRIYTHVLVLAHERSDSLEETQIYRSLLSHGVIDSILDLGLTYLRLSRERLLAVGATRMAVLIDSVDKEISELRLEIAGLGGTIDLSETECRRDMEYIRTRISPKLGH